MQIRFNRDYIWRPEGDSSHADKMGAKVRPVRRLTVKKTPDGPGETDAEVGPMFEIVVYATGKRFHAFADELHPA